MNRLCALFGIVVLSLAAACTKPDVAKRQHMERADALVAQGKDAEAVLEYKNALKIDRRFGDARFKLAELHARMGDTALAGQEYVRAADMLPERIDVQIKAATILVGAKQFEAARKYADVALKLDPNSIEGHLARAYSLAGMRDTGTAIREIEDAMGSAPSEARLHSTLGGLKLAQGNRAEAEAAFRKAVTVDPKSAAAKVALGFFLWSSNQAAEAEQVLKQAADDDRRDLFANRVLALFYLNHNRQADAETPLLRLVNNKDISATLSLAALYIKTQRVDQAKALYEGLKQSERGRSLGVAGLAQLEYGAGKRPAAHAILDEELKGSADNPLLLTVKARWLAEEGRGAEALEVAKKAVSVAPKSADAQFALGSAHIALRDSESAVGAFREALRLNPAMTAADTELSRLLLARGEPDEALKHARAAQAAQPHNPALRMDFAAALMAKKDYAAAEKELAALAAAYPKSGLVHSRYGQVLLAKGDIAGAARAYDQALAANPSDPQALAGRLVIDLGNKKPLDGRARLQRAIERKPNDAALLVLAAKFENSTGETASAEKYLRSSLEKDGSQLEAYTALGQMYMQQQRLDAARKEFEEVVKRQPDSIAARTMIGIILDVQQKPDESKKVYEAIVNGGGTAPVAANNLAWIYASRGEQLDIALQLAQTAKQHMPDSAEVDDTLGWIYYQKNLADLAVKALESSVSKDPRNEQYQYHLGLAYAKAGRADKARVALEQALRLKSDFAGAAEARKTLASLKG